MYDWKNKKWVSKISMLGIEKRRKAMPVRRTAFDLELCKGLMHGKRIQNQFKNTK